MKILWLSPIFPYPPFSGGQTRAYNLLKNLAKKNEITLFSFWRPNRIQGPVKEVEKFCSKVKTFKGRSIWSVRNFLLAGFSHLPFTITHFYGDRQVKIALQKELENGKYDLIHFESFYTSPYLNTPGVQGSNTPGVSIPTVLGNENVEYLVYQRFVQRKIFPLKWLLSYDIWKMRRYEQAAWRKANLNLAVSEVDARVIEKIIQKKCVVIPNGVDIKHFENFKPNRQRSGITLLFVGDFKYFTNQNAVNFLVKKIWPKIKNQISKASLKLVGRNPNSLITNLAGNGVQINSQIDDIRQAYASADILVAPMRIASGTNIKILEAMAAGLPVVTTSVGIEGIRAKKGKEVIIANQPDNFASEVIALASNKKRQQELSLAGKKLVEKLYDWPQIARKLERAYQELING